MKKILVIEDAQSLRRDILEMLSFEGFHVSGAENGIVGVERAKEYLPDLIICDIMMPALDGYGVLEQLRAHEPTATVPFIFLTARTDRVDMRHGMERGADDYLTKPFTANELLNTVHARLDKQAAIIREGEKKLEQWRQNIIMSLPHELRTPLNVILGFSDLLMFDHDDMQSERVGEMARHINNAALRLYRLIENFLIYSNIVIIVSSEEEHQKMRASFMFNPKATIEYAATAKVQQLERIGDLVMDVQDADAVRIAEEHLKKVVEELVDNAVKFSEPGKPIHVTALADKNQYTVKVSDQGRGMTPEQIKNVGAGMQFDRKTYEHQGSGLGLAIVKGLTEVLHDGTVEIISTPHEQTVVEVCIHLHQEQANTSSSNNHIAKEHLQS